MKVAELREAMADLPGDAEVGMRYDLGGFRGDGVTKVLGARSERVVKTTGGLDVLREEEVKQNPGVGQPWLVLDQ